MSDKYKCGKCGVDHKEGTKVYADHKKFEVKEMVQDVQKPIDAPPTAQQPNVKAMMGIMLVYDQDGKQTVSVPFVKGNVSIGDVMSMVKSMQEYAMTFQVKTGE